MILSRKEVLSIAEEVWGFPNLFNTILANSIIDVVDGTGTAYVSFDNEHNCVRFVVYKKFWDALNSKEKVFIICHEILHIFFDHGRRLAAKSEGTKEQKNIAADLAINERLYKEYGFLKEETPTLNALKIVNMKDFIAHYGHPFDHFRQYENTFEENLEIILKSKQEESGGFSLIDNIGENPSETDESDGPESSGAVREALTEIANANNMPIPAGDTDDEMLGTGKEAGVGTGDFKSYSVKAKKTRKWESIIIKAIKRKKREESESVESWFPSRRLDDFLSRGDFLLPSEKDDDKVVFTPDKKSIFLFMDASGSCSAYIERFLKLANSIPPEDFDVRFFSFDTHVKELKHGQVNTQVYGGGGTDFRAIENAIIGITTREGVAYPSAVFVITDGYGGHVKPSIPERWHWLLTPDSTSTFIPKNAKIYDMRKFE